MLFSRFKTQPVPAEDALPGRPDPLPHVPEVHAVNGNRIQPPFPEGLQTAVFGAGCLWGVDKVFWQTPGGYATAVGYAGGYTPNPTYEEVCSARTGHAEVVLVVFDPAVVSYEQLLKVFWEDHDPTQGMRQGNDIGTQYRSAIHYASPEQEAAARASRDQFQERLKAVRSEEVCSARTGHAEVVLVVFDPAVVSYEQLLKVFWEDHDPTQGMRQGNDIGTQYRSAIHYASPEQEAAARASRDQFQERLKAA